MNQSDTYCELKTGAISQRIKEIINCLDKGEYEGDVVPLMREQGNLILELIKYHETEIANLKQSYKDTDE